MSAPVSSQLMPEDDATIADVSAVSVVWTEAGGDPVDLDEFTITRDGIDYPVTITPISTTVFKVSANVGLWPDEQLYTITATAKSVGASVGSITWSFTTRKPFGTARVRGVIGMSTPSAARAVGQIGQLVGYSAGRAVGAINIPPHVAGFAVGHLTVREFRVTADRAKGKLTAARLFLIAGVPMSVESGIPSAPVMNLNSVEVQGVAPALNGPQAIETQAHRKDASIGSIEVGEPASHAVECGVEVGIETKSESPQGVEVDEGKGPDLHIDLVDAILSQVRE